MTYGICPRCTSWRLQRIETGIFRDRLLNLVNLRFCQCKDCGWRGIAKSREKRSLIKILHQPSTWKNILFCFLALGSLYAVSNLSTAIFGKHAPEEPIDVPASVTKAPSGPAMVKTIKDIPAVAVDTAQPTAMSPQHIQVIGNRDSKRYHLPGMKYYHRVEAYHRVAFSSEDEAIRAGYHKAPR